MRILKPGNKSPDSGSRTGAESGDLGFTAEQINFDSPEDTRDCSQVKGSPQAGISSEMVPNGCKPTGNPDGNQNSNRAGAPQKEYDRLLSKGVRLLSMREHSVQEMTTKLSVKCEALDLVYAVVDDLIELKYLSDDRFTESYVRSRRNRGFGPSKIRSELIGKGIINNMIDDYINVNSAKWYESAQNQYQKKYGDEPVKDYHTWAKRARFLQSRGFSMEHIQVTLPSVDRAF